MLWEVNCEDDESTHGYGEGRVCGPNHHFCVQWLSKELTLNMMEFDTFLAF